MVTGSSLSVDPTECTGKRDVTELTVPISIQLHADLCLVFPEHGESILHF